jgi:hypothetical protein
MSATPRTDAKVFTAHWLISWNRSESGPVVDAEFSRELECENAAMRAALHDIHIKAHCLAKAGPLSTPTLADAWPQFMRIAAMATQGLAKQV